MKKAMMMLAAVATMCLGERAFGEAVEVSTWADLKSNLEAGNGVMLTANVTQDAPGAAIDGKAVTLDLNGFTITGSDQTGESYRPLTLSNGANLTLTDSSAAKTGAIDGQGVSRSGNGGCAYVGSGCTFAMTGGTISNCTAASGGGVLVENSGSFDLSGGTITGNTSTQWGGGGICSSGKVTMKGGTHTTPY